MPIREIRKRRTTSRIDFDNKHVLTVFRSNQNLQVQLLEPATRKTLFTLSTESLTGGTKTERAEKLGELTGKKMLEMGVREVVFNRNGFLYHGRIAHMVDTLRKVGISI
jgi:large subunit ribosomal protein L18